MFNLIKPDINIDFMGARRKAFIVSGALVLASLALIAFKGFDLGIDFRGGSSAIVSFQKGTAKDHSEIERSVQQLITTTLGRSDTQVSVQGFGAGANDTRDNVPVDRLLIYTEITTMVDADHRKKIVDAMTAKWPDTRVASSAESGDTLYVTFPAEADITTRSKELSDLLASLSYSKVTVTSDFERHVEIEFLRDLELQAQDAKATAATAGAETVGEGTTLTMADLAGRKAAEIVGKTDRRFTVDIEAFQAVLEEHLAKSFPNRFMAVDSAATVSPSVGADLFNDGMLAMLYSLVGILIYVTLRFDFRYAPGGVIALAHDTIITMGVVVAFDLKFGLTIVAALLTIIGYSINDTIIIYDRVRETAQNAVGKDMLMVINRAVNNTLSRTLLTSGTTLVSAICIMVLGGSTVFDFGLCLTVGLIVGTYSSVYVASPFVYYFDNLQRKRQGDKNDGGPRKNRIGRDDSKKSDKKKTAGATA